MSEVTDASLSGGQSVHLGRNREKARVVRLTKSCDSLRSPQDYENFHLQATDQHSIAWISPYGREPFLVFWSFRCPSASSSVSWTFLVFYRPRLSFGARSFCVSAVTAAETLVSLY